MDLTSALQGTLDILKRRDAIKQALAMDLIDQDEARAMGEKLVFEYHVLRDIYLLPTYEIEVAESSQTGADLLQ